MQLISEAYCGLNQKLHVSNPSYGMGGSKWAVLVTELALKMNTRDILDYGCGKSSLSQNLPFFIHQYDPAIEKYSDLPEPADLVVCTDVLEHIEPECLESVLDHLQSLVKKTGFFVIATCAAHKTLEDGRNAHLIQNSIEWWLPELKKRFDVVNYKDLGEAFLVIVNKKEKGNA